jgi:ectoine hydroxylase-related dioxygenase (phytanoyl-CoA dioxygenase family)
MQALFAASLDSIANNSICERAQIDGYLLARQLIAADKVLEVRHDVLVVLDKHAWLQNDKDMMLAKTAVPACWEGDDRFWPVFDDIQRLESFHALAHDSALLHLTRTLLNDDVFPHPRNIVRLMFPETPTTPPHQDFLHVRGAVDTWTAWIPLGDCPRELGGLAVLPGSHRGGLLRTESMVGAGGQGIPSALLAGEWLTTDYSSGDVLLMHSLCVHKSTANSTADRLRLSVDYRYQRCADPVDSRALNAHFGRARWEDIYQGWTHQTYQHYWRSLPLKVNQNECA